MTSPSTKRQPTSSPSRFSGAITSATNLPASSSTCACSASSTSANGAQGAQARRGAEHRVQHEAHVIGAGLVVHGDARGSDQVARQAKLAALSASPPV